MVLTSQVERDNDFSKRRSERMHALVEERREPSGVVAAAAATPVERHRSRGKLLRASASTGSSTPTRRF